MITLIFGTLLLGVGLSELIPVWRSDPTLSHAPLLCVISIYILLQRRNALLEGSHFAPQGFLLLLFSVLLNVLSHWADVPSLSALSLLGMIGGVFWTLGGSQTLRRSIAPLGLLLFTIPWPTALTVRLQFWLQLTSSAYAALMAGTLGLPVHRDGVTLHVIPHVGQPPIYSMMVAQKCSGLSSLMALLALGYLVAWMTPIRFQVRFLFLLAVLPLTLGANALRLTLILAAGSSGNLRLAQFVHDNEQPVLMLFCGVGLMGLRALLLRLHHKSETSSTDETPLSTNPDNLKTKRKSDKRGCFVAVNLLLLAALVGAGFAQQSEARTPAYPDFFARFDLDYRDWKAQNFNLSPPEREMLQPDAVLVRRYTSERNPNEWAEISVIAGHRKKTVHNPAFCIGGDGWETVSEESTVYVLDGKRVEATRAKIMKDGKSLYATYFFTNGGFSCANMGRFQVAQIVGRLGSRPSLGALVRIITPVGASPVSGIALTDDFCYRVLPAVLTRLEMARQNKSGGLN